MENILLFITKNPIVGFISSVFASVLASITSLTSYIQLCGITLGIVIAVLTIYCKLLDIKLKKRKLENERANFIELEK